MALCSDFWALLLGGVTAVQHFTRALAIVLLTASVSLGGTGTAQAGISHTSVQSVTGTISEQRAQLRTAYYVSVQEYTDSRNIVSALPRGQVAAFSAAISLTGKSLKAAGDAISAATTQAQVDAAAALIKVESLRSATAKQTAQNLARLQGMRLEQIALVKKALADYLVNSISKSTYQVIETRASSFSTLLAADFSVQIRTAGQAVSAVALSSEPVLPVLRSGIGSITPVSGWTGFAGGCALPAAEAAFKPALPGSGPAIVTNSRLVENSKTRMLSDSVLAKEHAYLLRSATAELAIARDPKTAWNWFPTRVLRLGYGWLSGGDAASKAGLIENTRSLILSGPDGMESLRAANVLSSAATAADWVGGIAELEDTVLVRWLGPETCMLADRDPFVEGATNVSAIRDSASFLAAVSFLRNHGAQSTALAKASLTAIQPALKTITADGGTFEGPGYWNYQSAAVTAVYSTIPNVYTVPPIALPSLARVSKYALHTTTPVGLSVAFADSVPEPMSPLMPAWDSLVRKDSATAAWVETQYRKARDVRLLWWWAPPGTYPNPASGVYPETGLAVLQTSGATASLKGGKNGSLHSHLDLGSVSYFSKSIDWIIDPGPGSYSLPGYFSASQRWSYWKTGTASHSTMTDAGKNQPLDASAAVTLLSGATASVDMRGALPGTSSALRTVSLTATSLQIKDVVRSEFARDLKWQIVTDATVTVVGTTATMAKSGQTLSITFAGVPASARLSAAAAPETSATGASLTMLTLTIPQATAVTLSTTLK